MICRDTPTHGWVCGSLGGSVGQWVDQWVGSGQMTNNLINLDLIDIIQFCLKIYLICRDTPTHGWVCGSLGGSVGQWVDQWVGSGQMTNN